MQDWSMADNEKTLSADRVERAVYIARNERGAEVRIGGDDAEGSFTPGELLEIAAASCAALTADHVLSSRLGPEFNASFTVEGEAPSRDHRYENIRTELLVDMSELEPSRHEALFKRTYGAIEKFCSVARTLHRGATTDVQIKADQ